jgi:predicted RNA-binding Zn-ribbon protein involved in translation (DUF1610 family)
VHYRSRFEEQLHEELTWNPDSAAQDRLAQDESVLLESRGVTPQNATARQTEILRTIQPEFWRNATAHKNSVAAKLRQAGEYERAAKLENCHSYYTVYQCSSCGTTRKFPNRCDTFYCPECAAHLANERRKQIEWWCRDVPQPKHVVLTVRNIPDLAPGHIDELRKWFTALRRRKFSRNWHGGFYTIEVTNEKQGWHLHLHALISARWIDKAELSRQWNSINNNAGHIVEVKDCSHGDYLREVQKYIVKGSALAKWTPDQIVTFINAFDGKRTFGVFGELYAKRTEFAEWIAQLKAQRPKCDCGASIGKYYTESEWLIHDLRHKAPARPRPPPETQHDLPSFALANHWPD